MAGIDFRRFRAETSQGERCALIIMKCQGIGCCPVFACQSSESLSSSSPFDSRTRGRQPVAAVISSLSTTQFG